MAEPAPLSKEELAKKLVQEIANSGANVPDQFVYKNGFPDAIDDPELWKETLLIDLPLLSSSKQMAAGDELAKLRSALSRWGCFQVINHGIETSFLNELAEVTREFYKLPLDEKFKCRAPEDIFQGYGNDSIFVGPDQTADWNDRLGLTFYPAEKRKLTVYPQKPEKFSGMIHEYSEKLAVMMEVIYKAMARSLNLEEDLILKKQGDKNMIVGRFSYYPRCENPERILGVKPHTDGSFITILLPDYEVDEGLQVLKDDVWYKVPIIPGALFVDLGDLGEIMTNGIFKSVMHRVVTNSEKDRISVSAFCAPDDHNLEIEPLTELITEENPRMYNKITVFDYRQVFFQTYSKGRRALELIKV